MEFDYSKKVKLKCLTAILNFSLELRVSHAKWVLRNYSTLYFVLSRPTGFYVEDV